MSSSDECNYEPEKRKKSISSDRSKKKLRRGKSVISSKLKSKASTTIEEPLEKIALIANELITKYKNINRSELEAICERVLIYDSSGLYISPEEFKLNCQTKKRKQKSSKPREHNSREINPRFGKGQIGACRERFEHKVCDCCNNFNIDQFDHSYHIPPGEVRTDNTTDINQPFTNIQPQVTNICPEIEHNEEIMTDLDQPSCSGINKIKTNVQECNISSSDDIMKFVDLINEHMDNPDIWTEDYMFAINAALNNAETGEIENVETNQVIDENTIIEPSTSEVKTELADLLSDSLLVVNETPEMPVVIELNDTIADNTGNDNLQIEVVDLTSRTPRANRIINNNLEIIELLDDSPLPTSLRPGIVETIDLLDSESENENEYKGSVDVKPKKSLRDSAVQGAKSVLECPICLESLKNKKVMSTVCGHIFCDKCIKNVIRKTKRCPNCRKKLDSKSIHPLYFNF